jgi:site-specific recombinase XerD
VLSEEEIVRLLEAAPGPKYKAALAAACGAGLRASEVVALKVSDIDSKRMLLRIEQGKGRKDRYAMLSPVLLELLRDWYRIARPTVWLFPGRDRLLPLTTRQFNRAVHAAAHMATASQGASKKLSAQSHALFCVTRLFCSGWGRSGQRRSQITPRTKAFTARKPFLEGVSQKRASFANF